MSSPIDICNRALSEIGARSTIASFGEGSKEAQACVLWYDTLRKDTLRKAHWGFARKTFTLSQLGALTNGASPFPWPFKYLYPTDCLAMRFILPPTPPQFSGVVVGAGSAITPIIWGRPDETNRFEVANDVDNNNNMRKVILANLQNAQAVYTVDVQDTTIFDATFETALSCILSSKLVMPLTGKMNLKAGLIQAANDALVSARLTDGNEAMLNSTDHTPDWIAVRGEGAAYPGLFDFGQWFVPYDGAFWS